MAQPRVRRGGDRRGRVRLRLRQRLERAICPGAIRRARDRADRQSRPEVEQASNALADEVVETARSESYAAWVFDRKGRLITQPTVLDVNVQEVPHRAEALRRAQRSGGYVDRIEEDVTVVAAPIVPRGQARRGVLARADAARPRSREALEALREDRLTALGIAVGLAVLIGVA